MGKSNRQSREVDLLRVPAMIETKVTNYPKGSVINLIQKDYQLIAGDK